MQNCVRGGFVKFTSQQFVAIGLADPTAQVIWDYVATLQYNISECTRISRKDGWVYLNVLISLRGRPWFENKTICVIYIRVS